MLTWRQHLFTKHFYLGSLTMTCNTQNKVEKIAEGFSETLVSPLFRPGILLEAADLQRSVDYTQELMRLMVRHLFGCGVVCGLQIQALPTQGTKLSFSILSFSITAGLALDCLGRPIHVPSDLNGLTHEVGCQPDEGTRYQVLLSHRSEQCRMRETRCATEDSSDAVPTRLCEGYRLWIREMNQNTATAAYANDDFPKVCDTCSCSKDQVCCHVSLGVISRKNNNWAPRKTSTRPPLVKLRRSEPVPNRLR